MENTHRPSVGCFRNKLKIWHWPKTEIWNVIRQTGLQTVDHLNTRQSDLFGGDPTTVLPLQLESLYMERWSSILIRELKSECCTQVYPIKHTHVLLRFILHPVYHDSQLIHFIFPFIYIYTTQATSLVWFTKIYLYYRSRFAINKMYGRFLPWSTFVLSWRFGTGPEPRSELLFWKLVCKSVNYLAIA